MLTVYKRLSFGIEYCETVDRSRSLCQLFLLGLERASVVSSCSCQERIWNLDLPLHVG